MASIDKKGIKTIADNRKARHEYFVLESFEAGIELYGTEVKSIRAGNVNMKDCYCRVVDGEMVLFGMHIVRLYGKVKQEGLALIPLSLYFKGSRVKVQLGVCKGKKLYDKRATEAEREMKRVAERAMKDRRNIE